MKKRQSKESKILFVLDLIHFLSEHQGISIKEIKKTFHIKTYKETEELICSLSLLGKPPFSPGDYIDINIENQKVFTYYSLGLEKKQVLSFEEVLILNNILSRTNIENYHKKKFQHFDSSSVNSLRKLFNKVSQDVYKDSLSKSLSAKSRTEEKILEAVENKKNLEIDYTSLNTKSPPKTKSTRSVYPVKIIQSREKKPLKYLLAWDFEKKEIRNFNLDRILNIRFLNEAVGTDEIPSFKKLNTLVKKSEQELYLFISGQRKTNFYFLSTGKTFNYLFHYTSNCYIYPGSAFSYIHSSGKLPEMIQDKLKKYNKNDLSENLLVKFSFSDTRVLLKYILPVIDDIIPLAILDKNSKRELPAIYEELKKLLLNNLQNMETLMEAQ